MRHGRILLWLGAAALIAAAGGAGAAEVPLGKTLAGEACRLGDAGPTGPAGGAAKTLPIRCGDDGATTGTLAVVPLPAPLPDPAAARAAAIIAAAKSGDGLPAACEDGRKLSDSGDSQLFFCPVPNAAPRIVLVAVAGRVLYKAEGTTQMLPVLLGAIAANSGQPLSGPETEAAFRQVEARDPDVLANAGGVEIVSYKALVEVARLDAAGRDYGDAEAAYRRVLDIQTRMFGSNNITVGQTLTELALQVSNQGRFDEAQGLFRRAEPIIEAAPDTASKARLASYRALDAANQRHFADALKFARAATQMRRTELDQSRNGAEGAIVGSRGELAHSLRIEALMALRLGDLATALADATEVLRIIADEPSLPLWWRPEAVSMMAEIDARRDRVVPAERQFREAVAMQQKLFGDTAPTAMSEMRLGTFYVDQQVYSAAVEAFRPALDILMKDEVARATASPDQIVPFLTAAAAIAGRDAQQRAALEADAFRASQLVGSDVAGRTIARAAARLASDDPALADLLRKAQDAQRLRDALRIQLAAETAKPDERRDGAHERVLLGQLQQASDQADALANEVRSKFKDYANFAEPGPADLAELQRRLHQGEAFLSFVVGTRATFALLATQQGLTMARLALTEDQLQGDVTELRRAMQPRLGSVPEFDVQASYELYRKLLGPLEAKLQGIDHLIVAPVGALASLPLALLVTSAPSDQARRSYGEVQWLVRRMAVSEVPSPRAFLSLRTAAEHRTPAPNPLLAIGDPAFGGASETDSLNSLAGRCRENGPMSGDLLRALPRLKETAGEVRTVARLLGANDDAVLLGSDATEAKLRARPLDHYRVLYFATHGLLPGELHCQAEPGLVLSPPAQQATTTDQDGLLEASEIAGLKLDADLVVLSACNTAASGGKFGGEALEGLAGAFFNAGARAVLASHWEVPSLSTVKLMTGLFAGLAHDGGRGLAQALRQAQLQLIADGATAHPYNWAAFTMLGDGATAVDMAATPGATNAASAARGRT
jgi:CHAT domain-containing protein